MYLMYVDESGDTGLVNSPTRYFILCGLVLHELRWDAVLGELLNFRATLRTKFGVKLREELHASELINKPGALARIPKFQRLEVLRHIADKLGSLTEVSLIPIVVDKQGKAPTYDVFGSAWTALVQRFENTLSHGNFPGPKNADDRGTIYCDHTDDKKLTQLIRRMRNYNPIPNQAWAGQGYRNLKLKYVVEDPTFRDSRESQFVQMVDTCAYLLQQHVNPSKYFRSKSGQNYFSRLHPICCKHASRTDPNGVVRL